MEVPFLKLHMNNNTCAINSNNQALSLEEQHNLQNAEKQMQTVSLESSHQKIYSLKDLFESDPKDIENNVYQMVSPIEYKDQ